jgi:hypothetical protein
LKDSVFRDIRSDAGLKTTDVVGPRYDDLRPDIRIEFLQEFAGLAQRHNPIVRRIVMLATLAKGKTWRGARLRFAAGSAWRFDILRGPPFA